MADKVLVNLATGMEGGERVLVAFLVATAAVAQGKHAVVWTAKDAVRLGFAGRDSGRRLQGLSAARTSPPAVPARFPCSRGWQLG